MPIIPNFLERLAMLKLNITPAPFYDIFESMTCSSMCTALELGVFEALKDGPLSAHETARRINASVTGTEKLLSVLEITGYVTKNEEKYCNSPMSEKWMIKDSPQSIAGLIPFHKDILELWNYLGESIKKGEAAIDADKWLLENSDRTKNYHEAMLTLARMSSDEIAECVKLPDKEQKLIDIGGCHGLYSIKFCQHYPKLLATIFDYPEARVLAEKTIAQENIAVRVKFLEGNFFNDNIPNNYDIALLFGIIHMFNPEKTKELTKKVLQALNPNGTIIIMEEMNDESSKGFGQAVLRLQALRQFNSIGGKIYSFDEITSLLKDIGCSEIQTIKLRRSPGIGLIIGKK